MSKSASEPLTGPLRAREGGVLVRTGHTEAAVDLARLAGLAPCAVICEVLNDDGSIARGLELDRLAGRHDLARVTIADLVAYRRAGLRQAARLPEPFAVRRPPPDAEVLALFPPGAGKVREPRGEPRDL